MSPVMAPTQHQEFPVHSAGMGMQAEPGVLPERGMWVRQSEKPKTEFTGQSRGEEGLQRERALQVLTGGSGVLLNTDMHTHVRKCPGLGEKRISGHVTARQLNRAGTSAGPHQPD